MNPALSYCEEILRSKKGRGEFIPANMAKISFPRDSHPEISKKFRVLSPEKFCEFLREESPGLNPRNRFAISGDDIFGIGFGINSQTPRTVLRKATTYVVASASEHSISCLLIKGVKYGPITK